MSKFKSLLSRSCGATATLLGAPGLAQVADAPRSPQEANATGSGDMADIVVTARRRDERLLDVPVAITAFTAEAIRRQAIVDPEDLARAAPSVSAQNGGTIRNGASYSIRGQGASALGGEVAVATYFDEVATAISGPGVIFDLAGIEVLKGPQGTLFGRNTTGGAVLMTPQVPTNELGGYAQVTLGNYDHQRLEAAVNIPVIDDRLLVRLATDIYHRDGFTKDVDTGRAYDSRNYHGFRGIVLAKPADWIENTTLFNFSYAHGTESGGSLVNVNPVGLVALLFPNAQQEVADQLARGPRRVRHDYQDGGSIFRSLAINSKTKFDLGNGMALKNIFGYRDTRVINFDDPDGSIFPLLAYLRVPTWQSFPYPEPPQKIISDEVQFHGVSLADRLDWTAGFYFDDRRPATQSMHEEYSFLGLTTYNQALQKGGSRALYAQLTYKFLPELSLTAGGRYTWDKRSQRSTSYLLIDPCAPGYTPATGYCDRFQKTRFKAPTWNVNIQYQPDRSTMFYLASRRGYKSGGFNTQAPTPSLSTFDPEYVTDVELGAKLSGDVLGMKANLNAAAYRSNFRKKQVQGTLVTPTGLFAVTTNAGKGRVQGVELEGTVNIIPSFQISGFYALTDGKFKELQFNGIDFSDQPIPQTSKHKYAINGLWTVVDEPSIGDITLSGGYSWQSKFRSQLNVTGPSTNPLGESTPAYGSLNARIDWKHVGGSAFDVALYATNLANKKDLQVLSDLYNITGYTLGTYREPRFVAVQLRYSF